MDSYVKHVLTAVAAVAEFSDWSDEFARQHVTDALGRLTVDVMKRDLDYEKMTYAELWSLGFRPWDEEDGMALMLVPLYLKRTLREGSVLTSIGGETVVVGKDHIDNDHRFGCIAYGYKVAKEGV